MTTDQIAARANSGRIATPDMDLQLMLRGEVIPAFLEDVGFVAWRRITHDAEILADEYLLNLPINVSHIRAAYMGPNYTSEIKYVGDREDLRAIFQTTTTGIPTEYSLQTGIGAMVLGGAPGWTMVFNCPFSEDRTVRVICYVGSLSGDDYVTPYELDNLIPRHAQPALINGLRRLIYRERYGTGDRRFQMEDEEYARWIARLSEQSESVPSTRVVYVR